MQNAGNFMLVVTFYVRLRKEKKRKLFYNSNYFHFSPKVRIIECPDNSNYFHGPLEVRVIGIILYFVFELGGLLWKIEIACKVRFKEIPW